MKKLSNADVAALLAPVPDLLHGLAQERDALAAEVSDLRTKVAWFERQDRARAIVKTASAKGLVVATGVGDDDQVDALAASDRDLDVLEESVKLSSRNADPGVFRVGDAEDGSLDASRENVHATIMGRA